MDWKKQVAGYTNLLEAKKLNSSKEIVNKHMQALALELEKEYNKPEPQQDLFKEVGDKHFNEAVDKASK